jgi:hypothetical protein
MIQIKLIGMSMTSYYTKVHLSATVHELSPQNKLWILILKRPPCSYFLFLTKMVLLKVVHPLKKFHGPTLTGASFASTSEFWTPAILECIRYGIKMYGVEVSFNGMTSLQNFIKIYQLVQKLLGGGGGGTRRQTDWWSHKPHFPF